MAGGDDLAGGVCAWDGGGDDGPVAGANGGGVRFNSSNATRQNSTLSCSVARLDIRGEAYTLSTQRTHAFLTSHALIRQELDQHRAWFESKIGVPLSQAVIFSTELNLLQIGFETILNYSADETGSASELRRLRPLVTQSEIPDTVSPLLSFRRKEVTGSLHTLLLGRKQVRHRLEWGDCSIALKLHTLPAPIVLMRVSFFNGPNSYLESKRTILVAGKSLSQQVFHLLDDLGRSSRKPRLETASGGGRNVIPCDWGQLTLSGETQVCCRTISTQREEWYRKHGIPFRRGYLFHGPPGNGKTTAIRAMLTSQGLTAFTLRLSDPHTNEADLEELFDLALKSRPAMVLFEDLDRAFPKTGAAKSRISLQAILNALDGVGSGEGIVIVATANEPTLLDPAILRRPGRFDRLVHFGNPDANLRYKFLRRLQPTLDRTELKKVIEGTGEFSFAQMREVYVMAGQVALGRGDDVMAEDLLLAVQTMRQGLSGATSRANASGFK